MKGFRRPSARLLGDDGGYTLVELLTVLLILGVVMGGLTTVFASATSADADMNNRFQAQQGDAPRDRQAPPRSPLRIVSVALSARPPFVDHAHASRATARPIRAALGHLVYAERLDESLRALSRQWLDVHRRRQVGGLT